MKAKTLIELHNTWGDNDPTRQDVWEEAKELAELLK